MTATSNRLHEELAEAKVGRFHWRLGAIMGLLTLFDGYDTFNPAYVIHYVAGPWGLQAGQAGLLISSGLVGFLLGAAMHGVAPTGSAAAARCSAGLWITSIFTLLTAVLADSFLSFCVLRMLTGLGLGVLLPLATTYINELAPRRVANTFALWGVALGWAPAARSPASSACSRRRRSAGPVCTGSGRCRSCCCLHALHAAGIAEIPCRCRAGPTKSATCSASCGRSAPHVYESADNCGRQYRKAGNSVAVLLQPKYRRTTIAIWASAFLSLFCIFGLSGWIPTVMIQRGETFAASFGFGALMQIMSFIGGLALGHLVDRFGSSRGLLGLVGDRRRRGADPGVLQRPHRQRHVRRRRRLLHHRRAVRAQQLYRGFL